MAQTVSENHPLVWDGITRCLPSSWRIPHQHKGSQYSTAPSGGVIYHLDRQNEDEKTLILCFLLEGGALGECCWTEECEMLEMTFQDLGWFSQRRDRRGELTDLPLLLRNLLWNSDIIIVSPGNASFERPKSMNFLVADVWKNCITSKGLARPSVTAAVHNICQGALFYYSTWVKGTKRIFNRGVWCHVSPFTNLLCKCDTLGTGYTLHLTCHCSLHKQWSGLIPTMYTYPSWISTAWK